MNQEDDRNADVFQFASRQGRRLTLTVDAPSQSATLSCNGGGFVAIDDHCIQSSYVGFDRDEAKWLSSLWRQLFGRELAQQRFDTYLFALRLLASPGP